MPFPDFVFADCEMARLVFFPEQMSAWLLDDIVVRHCRGHDDMSESSHSLWLSTECRHLEFQFLHYCLPLLTREAHNVLYNKGRHRPNIQAAVFVLSIRLQGLRTASVTPETCVGFTTTKQM